MSENQNSHSSFIGIIILLAIIAAIVYLKSERMTTSVPVESTVATAPAVQQPTPQVQPLVKVEIAPVAAPATDNAEAAPAADNAEAAPATDNTEAAPAADNTEAAPAADNTEAAPAADNTEAAPAADNMEAAPAADNAEAAQAQ